MTECLFVYGTLMRSAAAAELGAEMRARLAREAEWLGPATMAGRLYNLGRYPAMKPAQSPGDTLFGEVYRLACPRSAFRWLDPYEGLRPGAAAPDYRRCIRQARLATGERVDAWVYLYQKPVFEVRRVESGCWRP